MKLAQVEGTLDVATVDENRTVTGFPQEAIRYLVTDQVGSTRLMVDEAGAVTWYGEYRAFGETSWEESADGSGTSQKYTSYTRDMEIGLDYAMARYYAPELGRFISEDPAEDGENWYAYVESNPLRFTDPTGLEYVNYAMTFNMQDAGWAEKSLGNGGTYKDKSGTEKEYLVGTHGCAVAGVAEVVSNLTNSSVTPSMVNEKKDLFEGEDIDFKKAADAYGLEHDYWTSEKQGTKGLSDKLEGYERDGKVHGILAEVLYKEGDSKSTHFVALSDITTFTDKKGVMYIEVVPTSFNDLVKENRTRDTWRYDKDTGKMYIAVKDIKKIDVFSREKLPLEKPTGEGRKAARGPEPPAKPPQSDPGDSSGGGEPPAPSSTTPSSTTPDSGWTDSMSYY
jgi:RHS repeat-associated protein